MQAIKNPYTAINSEINSQHHLLKFPHSPLSPADMLRHPDIRIRPLPIHKKTENRRNFKVMQLYFHPGQCIAAPGASGLFLVCRLDINGFALDFCL